MWKKIKDISLIEKHTPCIAYDSKGKTIGIWDGYCFESIKGSYSFDAHYSKNNIFYQNGLKKLIGKLTHWMPLPKEPKC
jgi:hypothetical protein